MARRAMFGETCFLFHVPPNMARLWPRAKGMAWPFFETLPVEWLGGGGVLSVTVIRSPTPEPSI